MTRRRRTMNTRYRILLNLPLLIIFRTAISVFCFWIWEENYLSPWLDAPIAASCKFLRISPTLLPSLILHISRVPNHSRLQSSRLTKPPNGTLLQLRGNVRLLLDICYFRLSLSTTISLSLPLQALPGTTPLSNLVCYHAYTP